MSASPNDMSNLLGGMQPLPDLSGRLPQDQAAVQSAQTGLNTANQNLENFELNGMPQQDQPPPVPKDQINKVMSGAPFMLAIAALGGKVGKIHGISMLKAMGGMTQGLLKGDDEAYKNSMEQYSAQMQQYQQAQETKWRNYEMFREALKDVAGGKQQALQMAYQSVGDDRQVTKDSLDTELKLKEYGQKAMQWGETLRMDSAKMANMASEEKARAQAATDRETAERDKVTKAKEAAGTSAENVGNALDMTNDLIKKIQNGHMMTGLGGKAHSLEETVGGSLGFDTGTAKHDYDAELAAVRLKMAGILKEKGTRDSAYNRAQIEKIIPGLEYGQNDKTVLSNLQAASKILQGMKDPYTSGGSSVDYSSLWGGKK